MNGREFTKAVAFSVTFLVVFAVVLNTAVLASEGAPITPSAYTLQTEDETLAYTNVSNVSPDSPALTIDMKRDNPSLFHPGGIRVYVMLGNPVYENQLRFDTVILVDGVSLADDMSYHSVSWPPGYAYEWTFAPDKIDRDNDGDVRVEVLAIDEERNVLGRSSKTFIVS